MLIDANASPMEQPATDLYAGPKKIGSMWSVYVTIAVVTCWMALATWGPLHRADPFSLRCLTMVSSRFRRAIEKRTRAANPLPIFAIYRCPGMYRRRPRI